MNNNFNGISNYVKSNKNLIINLLILVFAWRVFSNNIVLILILLYLMYVFGNNKETFPGPDAPKYDLRGVLLKTSEIDPGSPKEKRKCCGWNYPPTPSYNFIHYELDHM